ncbi:MAG: hypothetical protein JO352_18540 [Chloroflexi bacterium]|nr:hypothetical protein [Chloroflexota bacterium]
MRSQLTPSLKVAPIAERPGLRTLAAERTRAWFNVRAAAPRVGAVVLYAVAMAYVESAAVLYLRTIYGGVDPVGPRHSLFDPLPNFFWIEMGREAATMLMLASVGYLAATTLVGRIGAFAVAMGVWDIFYYVFLWLFAGWPESPLAADILFLIPLPWWGPVAAPILLAAVIVGAGAAAMARELGDGLPRPRRQDVLAVLVGGGLCLVAFMTNAFVALPDGLLAAFSVRGGPFPWPIYVLGAAVGCAGLIRALIHVPP